MLKNVKSSSTSKSYPQAKIKRSPLNKVSKKRGRNRSLRKRLWPELSKRIRARDGKCMMADEGLGKCGGGLQASHIYPKGKYPLLEMWPPNIFAACYVHHLFFWHRNPMEAAAWLRRKLGEKRIQELIDMKNNSLWRKSMDEDDIRREWNAYGI
jgi:5-methylcytosine-specific restriction endonuclease McrA